MIHFFGYALFLACLCLVIAALIPTISWIQCTTHAGGISCNPAAQGAREGWLTAANVLLGLVIQQQDSRRRP